MNRPKILIADDSAAIRKVVELKLAEEGMEPFTVADGEAAMAAFVQDEPDLFIADVQMPGMGALKLCEMIKQDTTTRHIPVILLTGSYDAIDAKEAERVGADALFTKPFDSISELVEKVRDLLEQREVRTALQADIEDIDGLYRQSLREESARAGDDTVEQLAFISDHEMADDPEEPLLEPGNKVEDEATANNAEEQVNEAPTAASSIHPFDSPADEFESVDASGFAAELGETDDAEVETSFPEDIAFDDISIEVIRSVGEVTEEATISSTFEMVDPFSAPAQFHASPAKDKRNSSADDKKLITSDNISPELLDAIVDRVVERLAERQTGKEV